MAIHFIQIQHIKKPTLIKNKYDDEIVKVVKERRKWLEDEINEERIKQERKPFEYKDETEEKHIKVSTTDKEGGYYHRDNKRKRLYVFGPQNCR